MFPYNHLHNVLKQLPERSAGAKINSLANYNRIGMGLYGAVYPQCRRLKIVIQ